MKKILFFILALLGVGLSCFCFVLMYYNNGDVERIIAGIFAVILPTASVSLAWTINDENNTKSDDNFAIWSIFISNVIASSFGIGFSITASICLLSIAVIVLLAIFIKNVRGR